MVIWDVAGDLTWSACFNIQDLSTARARAVTTRRQLHHLLFFCLLQYSMLSTEELILMSKVLDAVDSRNKKEVERIVNDPLRFSLFRQMIASSILPPQHINNGTISIPSESVSDVAQARNSPSADSEQSDDKQDFQIISMSEPKQQQTTSLSPLLSTNSNLAVPKSSPPTSSDGILPPTNPASSPADRAIFLTNTQVSTKPHKTLSEQRVLCA
ncbi:hypothetical protein NDA11_000385 [Ustilago hordei]|uniref:Uncharacterized protein n=1 Tax=Ustilago hordei TaxID=120017 RepID=I2G0X1_USTHO|nr:hypothetical protein NDA10_004658 [Ustilago hordei]KAJ1581117.1 hypothetical protein NDA15_004784 [Ustilago hordei]KAJ1582875.1 hypothetical protein NDA12_004771 [Ustilago hordei]KAJ1588503.1 hypothetical protein NDA11_000385 [Ustilago hordei]KAJ1600010.1 hypothetical protein NDA14_006952 [Ustilago hordei]